MSIRKWVSPLLAAGMLALSGCATHLSNPQVSEAELDGERTEQLALAVRKHFDRQVRLDRVAKKVAVAGADGLRDVPVAAAAGPRSADAVDRGATDTAAALEVAEALLPPGFVHRVISGLPDCARASSRLGRIGRQLIRAMRRKLARIAWP